MVYIHSVHLQGGSEHGTQNGGRRSLPHMRQSDHERAGQLRRQRHTVLGNLISGVLRMRSIVERRHQTLGRIDQRPPTVQWVPTIRCPQG